MRPSRRVYGTPLDLDELLRPLVRALQVFVGGALTAILVWLGWWGWAPVPLAILIFGGELGFWLRGDRPVTLLLGDEIALADPKNGTRYEVDPEKVRVAECFVRPRADGTADAFVLLAGNDGVHFTVQLHVDHAPDFPEAVDVARADRVLGGVAGVLRTICPRPALCRQVVEDANGETLAWFREHIAADAWQRVGARVWVGKSPPIDLLGMYKGEQTAWLELEGKRWRLSDGRAGDISVTVGRGSRVMHVMERSDQLEVSVREIPLLVLNLGGIAVATPAPLLSPDTPKHDLDENALHTHVPEGAALLWHILRVLPDPDPTSTLARLAEPSLQDPS